VGAHSADIYAGRGQVSVRLGVDAFSSHGWMRRAQSDAAERISATQEAMRQRSLTEEAVHLGLQEEASVPEPTSCTRPTQQSAPPN
jgi:hypothetical protein